MTDEAIASAKADIESTTDLLERALKLSGLITSLFAERGFKLVVVGGSAVEFYTEGGYMSGDIDFCRKTLNTCRTIPASSSHCSAVSYSRARAPALSAV